MDRILVKVLLVEDNPADVLLFKESLNDDPLTEFHVTDVESLRQGLDQLAAGGYDVVLLDLGLPDSQGLETFEAAHAEFPDVPMIVLSGASDEWLALQAVQSGAQDYLVKGEASWHFGARSIRYAIERHQSQLAMRASEARFSTVFHFGPTATAITRISDNCLLEVNEAWTQCTGYSSGQAIGRRADELNTWVDPAQRKAMLETLRRDGVVRGFEFRLRRKCGELADLLISAELIELSGEPCMLSMALDITERKQVENKLRRNEAVLAQAGRMAHLGAWEIVIGNPEDINANPLYWSDEVYRIFGHEAGAVIVTNELFFEHVHPDDRQRVADAVSQALAEKRPYEIEHRILRKDGAQRIVFEHADIIYDRDGQPTRILGSVQDITESRQAEAALRESEERLRVTLTNSNIIVAEVDEALRYTWIQNPHKDFDNAPIIGKCDDELGSNEGTAKLFALKKKVLATGIGASDEITFPMSNGNLTYLVLAEPRRNEHSDVVGVTTASIDITERKQVEEALRLSEERHRLISSMISDYVYSGVAYPCGRATTEWISGAFEQITGYTVEELKSLPLGFASLLLPEDLEKVASLYQLLFENRSLTVEYRIRRKDGEIRWLLDRMSAVADGEETHAVRIIGGVEDITERKQAELALQESQEQLNLAFRTARMGVWHWNIQANTVTWTPECAQMFGVSNLDDSFDSILEIIHPEDANQAMASIQEAFERRELIGNEYRMVTSSGETIWVTNYGHVKYDGQGRPLELTGLIQDVTERKLTQEKAAQAEKRFKSLIERAPDGVVLVGPGLGFSYVSPSARRIFGYGIDEDVIDILPDDATHPEDLPTVMEVLKHLIQDPSQVPTLQYRFRHKDGSWLWIESTFTNLLAEPSVEAIVINFRDVTERVEAERKIQESEERSRLAHDAADLGTWQEDLLTQTFTMDERARRHYDQDDEHPSAVEVARRVHPEDAPRLLGAITSSLDIEDDGRVEIEYRLIHRDGSLHWVEVYSRVHFENRNGERVPVLVVGTSQDITERKAAEAELARRNRQLRLIYEATRCLNISLDPAHVHEVIYASVHELMPCDTLFISDFDPVSEMISMAGGWHDDRPVDVTTFEPIPLEPQGSGIQSRVIRTQEPELIQDFQARLKNVQVVHHFDGDGQSVDELPEEGDIPRSALVVPLLTEGEVLGVIQVFSYRLDAYTEDDLQILSGFSAQAAIALSNARLYEHVRQENLERKRAEASLLVRTRQLASLFAIADRLGNTQSEEQALSVVIAEMESLMESPANGIALLEPDHGHFKIVRAADVLVVNLGRRFPIEEGLSGKVLREGAPCFSADYAADPLRVEDLADVETLGPGLFIPVHTEGQFVGVLFSLRRKDVDAQPFDQEDARLLNAVGEIMGSTLQRVRLFEQTNSQLNQLQTLHKMDRAITGSLDLGLTLRLLLTEVTSQPEVDAAAILLVNPHSLTLKFAASSGFRTRTIEQMRLMIGQGYAGLAALRRETLQVRDLQNCDEPLRRQIFKEEAFKTYTATPLIAKGKIVGVLELYAHSILDYGPDWDDFIETLASQATIAIENARLFTDLQRSNLQMELAFDATIEGWARAVELHAHETEGHSMRVVDIALDLAQALGMPSEEMIQLRRGALLHDIGKLAIPDTILLKPGPLTPEDWEVVRRHPLVAYELLQPIDYLHGALAVPYGHHEKWDGSGYPRGLAGEQIPLAARIFAVADVYEVLTSDRPYRSAWEHGKALTYIEEQCGKHFDPRVVDVFRAWCRPR